MGRGTKRPVLDGLRSRLALLLPGTAERRAQTVAHAAEWEARNRAVLAAPPERLWIALGDSTSQGIGASAADRGWVGQLLDLLRERDGDGWDVVNLSVTGARIGDVLADQLPRLADLPEPALVTCGVGANDMLRGRAGQTMAAVGRLCDALPDGTVVATIPRGVRQRVAAEVNEAIRARCADGRLRLADVWEHTGPPWSGKYASDGFHPNDRGYVEWVRAFCEPLGLPLPDRP